MGNLMSAGMYTAAMLSTLVLAFDLFFVVVDTEQYCLMGCKVFRTALENVLNQACDRTGTGCGATYDSVKR